jgi:hypothetical protein
MIDIYTFIGALQMMVLGASALLVLIGVVYPYFFKVNPDVEEVEMPR